VARAGGAALGSTLRRRPGVTLATVAALGCGGVVGWNVLMAQNVRHPSPMFRQAAAPVEPPRRPDMPVLPKPAPKPDVFGSNPAAKTDTAKTDTARPIPRVPRRPPAPRLPRAPRPQRRQITRAAPGRPIPSAP
jgi:hypothetical protein